MDLWWPNLLEAMPNNNRTGDIDLKEREDQIEKSLEGPKPRPRRWRRILGRRNTARHDSVSAEEDYGDDKDKRRPEKWSLGVLNDKSTDEVPGALVDCRRLAAVLR